MRRLLVALALCVACAIPATSVAAAPIHPNATQVRALNALTADVARLVTMTRTIAQGVEVPEKQIIALRATFARWNRANRAVFGPRLAAATALGRQGTVVLDAIEKVETIGNAASRARVAQAVATFNARVVSFSRLPFA